MKTIWKYELKTGWQIEGDPGKYVGTFQLYGGGLVFHVFWRGGGQEEK